MGRVDLLLDAGLSLRTQGIILTGGRVDLVTAGWLVVELDGFGTHAGTAPSSRTGAAVPSWPASACLRFS